MALQLASKLPAPSAEGRIGVAAASEIASISQRANASSPTTANPNVNTMQKWTQDQAIAFESARECIVHMMAICSGEIGELESRAEPDEEAIRSAEDRLSKLAGELRALRLHDEERISWVRREYGMQVREHLARSVSRPDST